MRRKIEALLFSWNFFNPDLCTADLVTKLGLHQAGSAFGGSLAKHSNVCPIRVDLPLAKLFEGGPVYRSGKASALKCDGAYMAVVVVEHHPGSLEDSSLEFTRR